MDSALVLFIAKEIPQLSLDEFKEVRVLHFADVALALHWGSGKMGRSRALEFSSYPAVSVPVLVYIDIDFAKIIQSRQLKEQFPQVPFIALGKGENFEPIPPGFFTNRLGKPVDPQIFRELLAQVLFS